MGLQKSFYTQKASAHEKLLHTELLHREAFTQRSIYTGQVFTERSFYTQQVFTQRNFFTEKLLLTASFYTNKPYKPLHTTLTHSSFYKQQAFTLDKATRAEEIFIVPAGPQSESQDLQVRNPNLVDNCGSAL